MFFKNSNQVDNWVIDLPEKDFNRLISGMIRKNGATEKAFNIVMRWKQLRKEHHMNNSHILISKDGSKTAIAPAYYIEKFISSSELTKAEFAKKCGIPEQQLIQLLQSNKPLSTHLCACLAKGTDTDKRMWENISAKYVLDSVEVNL